MQHWQGEFFCILHNIRLVCPRLGWYSVPGQCLLNYSTALENAQFLPVMCTPQLVNDCFLPQCAHLKKNGSREPEVFWMCASPQVGLCHIQELWPWHWGACVGNKTDKSEMIASSHGRNQNNLECWEWICKISMGIHRQAMAGVMGFLTFEEIWNDSKNKKIVFILKSFISWKVSSEKLGWEYLDF